MHDWQEHYCQDTWDRFATNTSYESLREIYICVQQAKLCLHNSASGNSTSEDELVEVRNHLEHKYENHIKLLQALPPGTRKHLRCYAMAVAEFSGKKSPNSIYDLVEFTLISDRKSDPLKSYLGPFWLSLFDSYTTALEKFAS